jgi:hypothetical protein
MQNPENSNIVYRQNPDVSYIVESNSLILINARTGNKLVIDYPQAAVWDLIIKNYTFDMIVRMISNILLITGNQSKSLIVDTLEYLYDKGFLLKSENG